MFRKKGPKVVISGYFGFDNCGDEAILYAMLEALRRLRPDLRPVVLSNNPEKTAQSFNVRAVNRWRPFKVIRALLGSRLFISGGGSLIQDVTSPKSPLYYLGTIRLGQIFAKKTMIYGQGLGPLNYEKNRHKTAKIFEKCDLITVRDEASQALLKEIGVTKKVFLGVDPVLALSYEDISSSIISEDLQGMGLLDKKGRKEKPLLLVCIRSWQDNKHFGEIAKFLDAQAQKGWDILLAPAHFPEDMEAIDKISNLMTERLYCLGRSLGPQEFLALTACADRVFSMRLHGLIFAQAMGVPMLGLSYDPKIDAFMAQSGFAEYCISYADFSWQKADQLLVEMDRQPLVHHKQQESKRKEVQQTAWEMAQKAIDLL